MNAARAMPPGNRADASGKIADDFFAHFSLAPGENNTIILA
jgi:hypothetical protein